jgi:DNA gyrase inhibitor GyrI
VVLFYAYRGADAPGFIGIKELPGGGCAVLSMQKDPAVTGSSIARFYQEYVPQRQLQIDGRRPTYEIHHESTMEYCWPIV